MERMRELIDKIKELNYHYYTLDDPLVSDTEYDALYYELRDLEESEGIILEDSPTQVVGDKVLDKFVKHTHLGRLYSLDKAQSYEEIEAWIQRANRLRDEYNNANSDKLPEIEYVVELKFDGLTINLTYNNGKLINAATRGTGVIGEEILPQVKTIKSIPTNIYYKGLIEVSGEGVMPLSRLKEYNENNEEKLKNARNAAAGALRNLDPKVTRSRHLECYLYNITFMQENIIDSQIDVFNFLKENGFNTYPFLEKVKDFQSLIQVIEKIGTLRKEIDVLTDGVVIKINDFRTRQVLGYTNKFPRWAIAYKFEAEKYTTIIKEVIWNVGRTGKVTPVALLDPVDIDGVTVQRATLNNYDDILRKKVRLGSEVIIRRSNDVIPEILTAIDENLDGTTEIEKPVYCPYCHTKLIYDNVHIYCPNAIDCKPQMSARLTHFASREAMNIEGLSEKTIEKMIEVLDISEIDDLYDLTAEDLYKLEGFKDKRVNNTLESIEKSKSVKLSSFIYALGIPNVGVKTAQDLVEYFKTLENIKNASFEELIKVNDIGDITAKGILDYFNDEHIEYALRKLLDKGIIFEEVDEEKSDELEGLTIVVTGTIEGYNRKEIQDRLKNMGAKVTSQVSNSTDIVLAGKSAGSKLTKARELNIKVYENQELNEFLERLRK
ncbi:NAD-dependent DNA ligase LigA [Helcococcus sueciensis]|uniref:NAD-dependent DNA ligase LigA n=1 Tax=Helcococcus sueciensis TaxID=241555 RepID=UPI00040176EC|nr:NAD-dependent DNA ligase LigA [Helcococcus sueciensis]